MSSGAAVSGKRVVVTGAARGLGREFVLHIAALGAQVFAVDIRESELCQLDAVADERGYEIATRTVDVTSAEETLVLADAVRSRLGGLDGLVNNAAVVELPRRPFDEIPEAEWDRVLAVNVKGPWLCSKALVPLLREAEGGSIVNLASEVAYSGSAGLLHYVSSKAAVIGLTRGLARELGPQNIRVNALAPGFIPTEGAAGLTGGNPYDTAATPLGRLGVPEDLLGALTFLLSGQSAFMTGQTLLVNGGRLFA